MYRYRLVSKQMKRVESADDYNTNRTIVHDGVEYPLYWRNVKLYQILTPTQITCPTSDSNKFVTNASGANQMFKLKMVTIFTVATIAGKFIKY